MKLTIFGATGGIGGHLLAQAVAAGHQVTAVVRDPARLGAAAGAVRVIVADMTAPDAGVLEDAVTGADAVLSALGARSQRHTGVAEIGTRAIVRAMHAAGARRLLVVSAAPVGTVPSPARPHPPKHDPGDGFLMRHVAAPLGKLALRRQFADLVRMEDVLRASDLEWTIFRPPRLTDRRLRPRYRTALGRNLRGGVAIARADVAAAMLAALGQPATVGETVGIAY